MVKPDGTVAWLAGRGQVVSRAANGRPVRLVNIMADITERKTKELHIAFLLREMTHRSKNLLAVVQSLATQTAKASLTMTEFQRNFERRLQGLSATHEVLVRETWRGAPIGELIREQLLPFVDPQSPRVTLTGPQVSLPPDTTQAIGLAIHELATNAVKYGALSVDSGRLDIGWQVSGDALALDWKESGGPVVTPPARKGFGHVVLETIAARSVGGEATLAFAPGGIQWRLTLPAGTFQKAGQKAGTPAAAP